MPNIRSLAHLYQKLTSPHPSIKKSRIGLIRRDQVSINDLLFRSLEADFRYVKHLCRRAKIALSLVFHVRR